MRYSANLGFLFTDRPLPDAIRAAKAAGFDAVECHFPYAVPPADVVAALAETGLPMVSLNTRPGDPARRDFGLAAQPGREAEARAAIDEAIDYAAAIGAGAVHVMAGTSDGGAQAEAAFRANLAHACDRAAPHGIAILIEPINGRDLPGYHLAGTAQALATIEAVARPNLKLMFDCYHVQILQGDLATALRDLLPVIGHVQMAAVPDRGEPGEGEVDLLWLMRHLDALGYAGYVGAEYRPRGDLLAGLGWLARFRA